jgi:ATP-dependent Clp protease ATP-binding subunit ClpB
LQLQGLGKRLGEQHLKLEFTPRALSQLATAGYHPAYGARPVNRAIRRLVEDPLSYALIAGDFKGASGIEVDAKSDDASADTPFDFRRVEAPASA